MAINEKDLIESGSNASRTVFDIIGTIDTATEKFQRGNRKGSIFKSAKGNVFEFPVFISSSVPLEYAEATTTLLEQLYASQLQMAISINPVVDSETVRNGLQFADFKTDTNKYLEHTDMFYAHDACHAVYKQDNYIIEFNMLSIEDSDAKLINEYCDYEPLSEFEHFFQEAAPQPHHIGPNGHERKDTENTDIGRDKSTYERTMDEENLRNKQLQNAKMERELSDEQQNIDDAIKEAQRRSANAKARLDENSSSDENINYDNMQKQGAARKAAYEGDPETIARRRAKDMADTVTSRNNATKSQYDAIKSQYDAAKAASESSARALNTARQTEEEKLRQLQNQNDAFARNTAISRTKDVVGIAKTGTDIATSVVDAVDKHKKTVADLEKTKVDVEKSKLDMEKTKLQSDDLKRKARDYDDDRRMAKEKHEADIQNKEADTQYKRQQSAELKRVKAPTFIDETKIQKLNTMKPLMMNVSLRVEDKKGTLSTPVDYIVGVKTHSRLVDAEILPEVAEYPLKEMDKLSRKAKWRAGELKFLKDIVFRIKQKKQTAIDSKDPRRKWYRRLYELAHMKGDAPAASVVQGRSLIATWVQDKLGKGKLSRGVMPNVSMIITQSDVNNIKSQTDIDLLNDKTAVKFCDELFLMALIVIDNDAESIKIMTPDLHNDFEIHSLAAVNKQISMLDTSGTKTRDMFKLLG